MRASWNLARGKPMRFTNKWMYAVVAIAAAAVSLSGLALYVKLAAKQMPERATAASDPHAGGMPSAGVPGDAAPSMDVAADRLAQRLKANGGTVDDWVLLARSYAHLKRYPEAVDAYAKAIELAPGDKTLIEAQAAARKAGGMPPAR